MKAGAPVATLGQETTMKFSETVLNRVALRRRLRWAGCRDPAFGADHFREGGGIWV